MKKTRGCGSTYPTTYYQDLYKHNQIRNRVQNQRLQHVDQELVRTMEVQTNMKTRQKLPQKMTKG